MLLIAWRQFRSGLPVLLRGAGALLLCYVAIQYSTMRADQRRLLREWSGQNAGGVTYQRIDLTRLVIPRINLDAVVVEGTSNESLMAGPGHMDDTAAPGDPGNSIIAGHRDTFFRRIHELNAGDIIVVSRGGRQFNYRVVSKSVTEPENLQTLENTSDAQLTLITCYPTHYIGPAPKRLIVKAELT